MTVCISKILAVASFVQVVFASACLAFITGQPVIKQDAPLAATIVEDRGDNALHRPQYYRGLAPPRPWRALDPFGDFFFRGPTEPGGLLDRVFDRMEKELEGTFPQNVFKTTQLPIDFIETNDTYSIQLDIPGVGEHDLKVSLDEDMLTITAQRNDEKQWGSSGGTIHRQERRFGKMSRTILLPQNADRDSLTAKYENGVLLVAMNKLELEEPDSQKDIAIEFKKGTTAAVSAENKNEKKKTAPSNDDDEQKVSATKSDDYKK